MVPRSSSQYSLHYIEFHSMSFSCFEVMLWNRIKSKNLTRAITPVLKVELWFLDLPLNTLYTILSFIQCPLVVLKLCSGIE